MFPIVYPFVESIRSKLMELSLTLPLLNASGIPRIGQVIGIPIVSISVGFRSKWIFLLAALALSCDHSNLRSLFESAVVVMQLLSEAQLGVSLIIRLDMNEQVVYNFSY